MNAIAQLLALADAYGSGAGVEAKTVSWRVFGDTKKLNAIQAGADIQVGRYEKAVRWFTDNWPADTDWPIDVPRPAPTQEAAA